jgi:hypothetical protein
MLKYFILCSICGCKKIRFLKNNDESECTKCHPEPTSVCSAEVVRIDTSQQEKNFDMCSVDILFWLLVQSVVAQNSRVVLFCNQYEDSFTTRLKVRCPLLEVFTFLKGNKNKHTQNIAKFSSMSDTHPMLMVMSTAHINGTDLKNVTAVVIYGKLTVAQRYQVMGRCLRMHNTNQSERTMIANYEIVISC